MNQFEGASISESVLLKGIPLVVIGRNSSLRALVPWYVDWRSSDFQFQLTEGEFQSILADGIGQGRFVDNYFSFFS